MNHTPGPWMYHKNLKYKPRGHSSSNGWIVRPAGEAPHGRWIADCGFPDDPEAEANARLIAAAPTTAAERDRMKVENAELLAALKDAYESLSACFALASDLPYAKNPQETSEKLWEESRRTIPVCRAAIAKAEGRADG